ncbi:RHS repeat-associated core domain-containing protein [Riemerella anatipestifer]|uniref:RHS repeat-associated core domain-containing protein n=1 Tax=Riemerella anatipestifer TaxID=34085 RepID=UPI0030BDA0AA
MVRPIGEKESEIYSNTITYDANGNMISLLDKKISRIGYNTLNLPNQVQSAAGNLSYTYRADGVKVSQQRTIPNGFARKDYIDGFQYEASRLQFFPTAEGYYDYLHKRYVYHYTDHLGNVRLSYYKGSNNLVIDKESNYYPFGLEHTGYNGLLGNQSYNYKYNGKELQTEIGMYDYGARFYMPDIVIWGQLDPLSEKYYKSTPYAYVLGNPISNYDPDGMQVENDYKLFKNGEVKLIKETNDKSDTLYATDDKGNVDISKSVTVQKANASDSSVIGDLATQTISDKANGFDKINYARTANSNDAANVYMFTAKNSNVEWGIDAYNVKGSPLYTIYTGHDESKTPSNFRDQSLSKLIFSIHSHKNLNEPSPINGLTNGDYGVSRYWDNQYYKRTGKTNYPSHYLYHAPNNGKNSLWKYHWLNKDTHKKNLGTSIINLKKLSK